MKIVCGALLLALLQQAQSLSMDKYVKKIAKKLNADSTLLWKATDKLPKGMRGMTKEQFVKTYYNLKAQLPRNLSIEDLGQKLDFDVSSGTCKDKYSACPDYSDDCDDKWFQQNCPLTCKTCPNPNPTPNPTPSPSPSNNTDAFDWIVKNPSCAGPVMDQGQCGSCWAYSTTSALSSTYCFTKNNGIFLQLSPVPMITCTEKGGNFAGCDGNQVDSGYIWAKDMGMVSQSCDPFTTDVFTSCGSKKCKLSGDTPVCVDYKKCLSSTVPYNPLMLNSFKDITPSEDNMKAALQNGPITIAIECYDDFQNYSGGIYHHSKNAKVEGGHAMKMVGYGVENGVKYWRIQNSWGSDWGENGFIRILRGTDESGIEDQGAAQGFW